MTLLNLLNRRERILFYITLVIILSFLIFHFLVVPLFSKFVKLNKEIIATKIKLEKSLRLIAEKDSILSVSDKISTSGDEKKELFLSRILSKLEEFSAEAGLKIIEIRPQISKEETSKQINIQLNQEGKMEQFFRFFYLVETSQILRIKKLNLFSKPSTSYLEAEIILATY